jgi:phage gpG-like protein
MLQISLDGAAEFSARLDALKEKVQALASALYAQVVGVNLSGSVLNGRSGALRDSIQIDVQSQDSRIDAEIFSDGDVPYAAILEFGGKTAAHEILPDKARALAFLTNGKQVFARRIQHPGSTFAARSYLGGALDDASGEIASTLREVIAAAAEQLKESR